VSPNGDTRASSNLALRGALLLHRELRAKNRAPVLVFRDRHAALDTHADSRLWRLAFSKQTLQ
jgi:hypothetical protein